MYLNTRIVEISMTKQLPPQATFLHVGLILASQNMTFQLVLPNYTDEFPTVATSCVCIGGKKRIIVIYAVDVCVYFYLNQIEVDRYSAVA